MNAERSIDWTVTGRRAVVGDIHVPGDKSISHRALMLAALAHGPSRISNLSAGADVASTLASIRSLGIEVTRASSGDVIVVGGDLVAPSEPLDFGNAGTGIRLMCGVLAGQSFMSVLTGDQSLRRRPMARVVDPLSSMGARIEPCHGGFAPLVCLPAVLTGIDYTLPVRSAQVKSAVLLAGVHASGSTSVTESVKTRTYTEDMLADFGARVERDGGRTTVWRSELIPHDVDVPGDPSQSAFWAVAAALVDGSSITMARLELSGPRAGYLRVLERMNAAIGVDGDTVTVSYVGRLRAAEVTPEEVPSLVDEIPALAVAAAAAQGTSVFHGLAELVHKESDRLSAVHELVRALGARSEVVGETLTITGVERFRAFNARSRGDHRMAMSAAVAALNTEGTSIVRDVACVDTSYPGFLDQLEAVAHD